MTVCNNLFTVLTIPVLPQHPYLINALFMLFNISLKMLCFNVRISILSAGLPQIGNTSECPFCLQIEAFVLDPL